MKKSLIAIALAAMMAPAWGEDVVSSNIVGYEKVTLTTGFNIVGLQFNKVGGQSTVPISDAGILDASLQGFTEDGDYFTFLKTWDGENYTRYGWSGSSGTDVLDDASLDNKWLNDDLEETADTFSNGQAAWIIAEHGGTMIFSGEVPSGDVTVDLTTGFNLVCNPFPQKMKISDFGVLDASFKGFTEDGDYFTFLKTWDGENYTRYGWSGSSGTDVLDDASLDNKWLNDDLEETDDEIEFGKGVWIIAEKAGTITFTNPIQ